MKSRHSWKIDDEEQKPQTQLQSVTNDKKKKLPNDINWERKHSLFKNKNVDIKFSVHGAFL